MYYWWRWTTKSDQKEITKNKNHRPAACSSKIQNPLLWKSSWYCKEQRFTITKYTWANNENQVLLLASNTMEVARWTVLTFGQTGLQGENEGRKRERENQNPLTRSRLFWSLSWLENVEGSVDVQLHTMWMSKHENTRRSTPTESQSSHWNSTRSSEWNVRRGPSWLLQQEEIMHHYEVQLGPSSKRMSFL